MNGDTLSSAAHAAGFADSAHLSRTARTMFGLPPSVLQMSGPLSARARELRECRAGDLLMIKATGAYGASMASTYNSRPLAAEVLLDDGRYAVIRRRQTLEEMLIGEQAADHWKSA